MCYYTIPVCPYPHDGPLSIAIFDPKKSHDWIECDKHKPWGRLSCGDLIVQHSIRAPRTDAIAVRDFALCAAIPALQRSQISSDPFLNGRRSSNETPDTALRSRSRDTSQTRGCIWCTKMLRYVSTRAIATRQELQHELQKINDEMQEDTELKQLQAMIAEKEKELDVLRHFAWKRAQKDGRDKF